MDDKHRLEIREEVRKMLAFFTEAELLVLKTHVSIHRSLTRIIAARRGVATSSLRRLTFLAAAKQAHGPDLNKRLLRSLELLNEARNIVAHEEFTGDIFIKVGEIGRLNKGPGYIDSPANADEANTQFREVLQIVEGWASHP
jgi:hypothetical protein